MRLPNPRMGWPLLEPSLSDAQYSMSQHLFVRGIDPIDGVLPGQNPMGFPQLWPTAIDGFWNYLVMGRSSQKKIGALKL